MTSRLSAVGLLTLLFVTWVAATAILYITYRQTPVYCSRICQQDIASATYFGLLELDCDGQWDSNPGYYGGSPCQDELANVNRLPRVDRITHWHQDIKVEETFFLTGAVTATFSVWVAFTKTGELAGRS